MADEDNKTEQSSSEDSKSNKSSKSPLVLIVLFLNTIGLGVVAFMQYQFMQLESKRPDLSELLKQGRGEAPDLDDENRTTETLSKEYIVNLESFTVNLAQGDGPRRYLRMNAVLKMDDSSDMKEIENRRPQIRDTIIGILNQKRPEEVLKRDGKLYLKEQIKSSINSFLVDGKVEDIFYIGFQVN